jgi:hypothetical protein
LRSASEKRSGAAEEHERHGANPRETQDGRRAQDSRRRPDAEAGAVSAMRLSLLVDAAGAGA